MDAIRSALVKHSVSHKQLAIIVPVLNEAAQIPLLAANLSPYLSHAAVEVILVDGGSWDNTVAFAQQRQIPLIQSARGRATQMNAGAEYCSASTLLFLHADTRLPEYLSVDQLLKTFAVLADSHKHWGRFDVQIHAPHKLLRVVAHSINLRSRVTGIATGDQAIFVRRSIFNTIGGYATQPIMEDIALSKILLNYSRPLCLRHKVTTSGRRWEEKGVWQTILLMWRLRFYYWIGVPPEKLSKLYL